MRIFLLLIVVFLGFSVVSAQPAEQLSVKFGKQKMTKRGHISVKFIEMIEDSRCPTGVNCIWAGVARIKIRVTKNRKTADFELNTNQQDKPALFEGYSITLKGLTPHPSTTAKYSQSAYTAALFVAKQ